MPQDPENRLVPRIQTARRADVPGRPAAGLRRQPGGSPAPAPSPFERSSTTPTASCCRDSTSPCSSDAARGNVSRLCRSRRCWRIVKAAMCSWWTPKTGSNNGASNRGAAMGTGWAVESGLMSRRNDHRSRGTEGQPRPDGGDRTLADRARRKHVFSRIFIERPRLAIVISIIITLAGVLALLNIPIAQYPQITPPEIRVQRHLSRRQRRSGRRQRGRARSRPRSTAWRTCSTCPPPAPTTAATA